MDRRAFSLGLATLSLASGAPSAVNASELASKPDGASSLNHARCFSHVGKEKKPFLEKSGAILAEQEGSGFLNHMWFGGDFPHYRQTRLRIYIDHEEMPSIDMELGMGVGVGFADPAAPWGTQFAGITGAPSGIFCNYRIPFAKHIRIVASLPEGVPADTVFWWIIRGVEGLPLEFSGLRLENHARLKLYKNVDLTVPPLEEFDLCKVAGRGMLFQVTMAARSSNYEYLEGQMRAYFGEDSTPQFLSSGLEDYFLGTYYFNRGLYHLPQAGLTHKDDKDSSFSAYRFHDIDPIFFSKGLRLACRCGEKSGNKVFGPTGRPHVTTYTTYAWVYEW